MVAGLLIFLASILQSTQSQIWDAANYWHGAEAIARGSSPYEPGAMAMRGAFTSLMYLPAALVTRVYPSAAEFSVLVENSVLIAILGAVIIPKLAEIWRPRDVKVVYVSAGLTWLILARYAPYALSDLWAVFLVLCAVLTVRGREPVLLLAGGLAAGVAMNVRPAYLLTVAGLAVVLVIARRGRALFFIGASLASLMPQLLVTHAHGGGWSPFPPLTSSLTRIQVNYAAWVTRYDTVGYVPAKAPQLFFCDPRMAGSVKDAELRSTGQLVSTYLHHLPGASLLSAEKLGGVIHWPVSAPYYAKETFGDTLFALLVTAVAVLGVAMIWSARHPWSAAKSGVAVVWLGAVITVVTSTPETRFALPLVVIGISGCAVWFLHRWHRKSVAVVAALVAVVFAFGVLALHNPAPAGMADARICASQ